MVAVIDCPHVCCYDRRNREHVHVQQPAECDLCDRAPVVASDGRLQVLARWAGYLAGAAAVVIVLGWLAVSVLTGGWAAG